MVEKYELLITSNKSLVSTSKRDHFLIKINKKTFLSVFCVHHIAPRECRFDSHRRLNFSFRYFFYNAIK